MLCAVCRKDTPVAHGAGRPRKYCSTACRQRAYRQRHEHVSRTLPAPNRPTAGDGAGQVVAVLYVPAAMAEKIENKVDAGLVIELGILSLSHINPRPATLPPGTESQTSSLPDPGPRAGFRSRQ